MFRVASTTTTSTPWVDTHQTDVCRHPDRFKVSLTCQWELSPLPTKLVLTLHSVLPSPRLPFTLCVRTSLVSSSHLYPQSPLPPVTSTPSHLYPQSPLPPVTSTPSHLYPQSPLPPVTSTPSHLYPQSPLPPVTSTPSHLYPQSPLLPVTSTPSHLYPQSPLPPVTSTPSHLYSQSPLPPVTSTPSHLYSHSPKVCTLHCLSLRDAPHTHLTILISMLSILLS